VTVLDIAKRRARSARRVPPKAGGPPLGKFRLSVISADGNINLRWLDDQGTERLLVELDPEEARALCAGLNRSVSRAQRVQKHVRGIVALGWCRTDGVQIRSECVRGRIVTRVDTCVWIYVDPDRGQQMPREGWPESGWYRFNGWPVDHKPGRRGWCVVSGSLARQQGSSV
jgi:hypothetical protein